MSEVLRLRSLSKALWDPAQEIIADLSTYQGVIPLQKVRLPEIPIVKDLIANYKFVELFNARATSWHVTARCVNSSYTGYWHFFATHCPVCGEEPRFLFKLNKRCVCLNGHRIAYEQLRVRSIEAIRQRI